MVRDQFKTICLWGAKLALFVVPFVPLIIAKSMFFPYITGKAFLFRTLVQLAFALYLALAIFYKEYRPRWNALTLAILVFVAVAALATIFGVNPSKSFWSNYERMEGLLAYLHLAAYFFALGHLFEKRDWLFFFNLFVISGIVESGYVFMQKLGYIASPQGGVRVDGTIGNSTYLAAYLIFVLGFSAILWLHAKTRGAKVYYGIASALALASVYFTATRGAILAILIAGFLFACIYLFLVKTDTPRGKFHRKIGLGILAAVACVPILFLLLRDTAFVQSSPVLSRFRNLSLDDARAYIWQMSYEGFRENPILGWGPENYGVVFAKYFKPQLYAQEPWFDRAHNIVFDWLINAGILGLLSYFGIFAAAGYLMWRNYAGGRLSLEVVVALSLLLVVYVLQNFFVFDNIATYLSFFTVLAYIYNLAVFDDPLSEAGADHQSRHKHYSATLDASYLPLAAGAILLPLIFIFYYVIAKPFLANRALLDALRVAAVSDVRSGLDAFKLALSYDAMGNAEIREQLVRFADAVTGSSQIPDDFKMEVFRLALAEAQKSIDENPLDPRPLLFIGVLYNRAQLYDESVAAFRKALTLAPNKQQILFELADVHLRSEQYKQALELIEKAYNLEPRFAFARLNLIATLILDGQIERSDKLLAEHNLLHSPEKVLLQAYAKVGDIWRLARVFKNFVREYPEEWVYRDNLVRNLVKLGDSAGARAVLDEAARRQEFIDKAVALSRELGL